jgi:hypothetical protein
LFNNNCDLASPSEVGGGWERRDLCLILVVVNGVPGGVMSEKGLGRKRIIGLRLTGDEYGLLEKNWKKSTIRKLSEYVRRVLFGKAVTVYTRNQSLDELVSELILLRKELNAIGVNFNQAVHRLHTLDHLPQMQRWLQGFERDKDGFFLKVEEIRLKVNSISEQWLQ